MGYASLHCVGDDTEIKENDGYKKIIDSWGFKGMISDVNLNSDDNVLSFLHDGIPTSCPAEIQEVHQTRINQAQELRTRVVFETGKTLD